MAEKENNNNSPIKSPNKNKRKPSQNSKSEEEDDIFSFPSSQYPKYPTQTENNNNKNDEMKTIEDWKKKLEKVDVSLLSVDEMGKLLITLTHHQMMDEFMIIHAYYQIQHNEISFFEFLLKDENLHEKLHELLFMMCQKECKEVMEYVLELNFFNKIRLLSNKSKFSKKYLKMYCVDHKTINMLSEKSRKCFQMVSNTIAFTPSYYIPELKVDSCFFFKQNCVVPFSLDSEEFVNFWKVLCKSTFGSVTIPMFDVIYQKVNAGKIIETENNNSSSFISKGKSLLLQIVESEKMRPMILEILHQTCLESNENFLHLLSSNDFVKKSMKDDAYWKENLDLFTITKENELILQSKPEIKILFKKVCQFFETL